jgi:hypothetical protein
MALSGIALLLILYEVVRLPFLSPGSRTYAIARQSTETPERSDAGEDEDNDDESTSASVAPRADT